MKLYVFAITLAFLALAMPTEAGPNGFGRCELKYESVAEDVEVPTGVQCYWSGPGGGCWYTYTDVYVAGERTSVPTGFECGY